MTKLTDNLTNHTNDLGRQKEYWGDNYEYYAAQMSSDKYKKWNWAAFFFSIPWLVSKQLYKKAAIISGIGISIFILTSWIEIFYVNLRLVFLILNLVYAVGILIFIPIKANAWVGGHFKQKYRKGVTGHSGILRVLVFILITAASFWLRAGAELLLKNIHSHYVVSVPSTVFYRKGDTNFKELDGTVYFASHYGEDDITKWHTFINSISPDGILTSVEYELENSESFFYQRSLFTYNDRIFHIFVDLHPDSSVVIYSWDKSLNDFKVLKIPSFTDMYTHNYLDNNMYRFDMKAESGEYISYSINLDTMTYSYAPRSEESTNTSVSDLKAVKHDIQGTGFYYVDESDILDGSLLLYKGEKLIEDIYYDTLFQGDFEGIQKLKDHLIILFSNTLFVYSIEDESLVELGDSFSGASKPILVSEGLLFLHPEWNGGYSYMKISIFTGNKNGLFDEYDFPIFSKQGDMHGWSQHDSPQLIDQGDSYLVYFRVGVEEIAFARLSKDYKVLPF